MRDGPSKPNVVLVITDDQGYADLGCTGNPWLLTPAIDRFQEESVRLTDFHVSPLCTPTRGALMTGRRPVRNGAWATTWGRSLLSSDEVTMADVFAANGYRTGLFGKWHLGDNFPYRPQDRGFRTAVWHKGGGVGQVPDYWGNNYFDDTYFHGDEARPHTGYCTDIWFEEALGWIEDAKDEPFFAYISTNAPHFPYLVEERYEAPYRDDPDIAHPDFYGMIANIDENFGRLRERLGEWGIERDTILIFMTDNGSSGACEVDADGFVTRGYNAGMRGKKGSYYDGGHRVPFFIRWPAGGIDDGRDVRDMTLHLDVLPTLIDLCGLAPPDGVAFDGTDIAPLLRGRRNRVTGDRTHSVQYRQSTDPPRMWDNAVMTRRWRLIGGTELYDIEADPGQRNDVADEHPDVIRRLRTAHEHWWQEVREGLEPYCPISLGADEENPTRLDAFDVHGDVAWHQGVVAMARKTAARWAVKVEVPGTYRFRLRRWPEELGRPIHAACTCTEAWKLCPIQPIWEPGRIKPDRARLVLFEREYDCAVHRSDVEATFEVDVEQAGETSLEAWFVGAEEEQGAYYVYAERL
jgi:arylsulfatase A-like enzyme